MPHYLVVGRDGKDEGALARRMAAREGHFATTKPMVERGQIVAGGAILDDDGKMIGSAMMVNFAERSELDAWLASDPYKLGDVWRTIEITPMLIAGVK
jgi:uncharacterized protein YciI